MIRVLLVVLAAMLAMATSAVAHTPQPAGPTGLAVTGTTSTSVTLNWNDHSQHANLLRYNVRQYTPAGVTQRTIFATKTSAHTVTGLTSGTSYKFAVAGVFPDGHVTQYSAQVQATAGGTPPPPPPPPSADPQPEGITWNGRRLSSWVVQHCPPFTTVTEMSESIGSFFRVQVNASGESCWGPPGGATGSRHRAQVIPPQNTPGRPVPRFQTRYYDFGVRFPSGFGNMDNSHCDVFGFVGASMLLCTGNHADMEGQWLTIDRPHECGWRAPLQKGQGWHHFVWKVYHDVGAAGRLTVWHKPPGASAHSRVITNCAVETWTNTFGNATSGSHLTHQNYHGANDPIASQPWSDHRGVIQSTGHQID
jgi:Fibronectin type III domain